METSIVQSAVKVQAKLKERRKETISLSLEEDKFEFSSSNCHVIRLH